MRGRALPGRPSFTRGINTARKQVCARKAPFSLDVRTHVSENVYYEGALNSNGAYRSWRGKVRSSAGSSRIRKGQPWRLYFGEEYTTLKDRKKEVGIASQSQPK